MALCVLLPVPGRDAMRQWTDESCATGSLWQSLWSVGTPRDRIDVTTEQSHLCDCECCGRTYSRLPEVFSMLRRERSSIDIRAVR